MLKRKPEADEDDCPHARLGSIYDSGTTRRQRRRVLFRTQSDNTTTLWQPKKERDMTELLEYILKHEEAFQK